MTDFATVLAAKMKMQKPDKADILSIIKEIRNERAAKGSYKGQNLLHDILKMFPEYKREALKLGMTYGGTSSLAFKKYFENEETAAPKKAAPAKNLLDPKKLRAAKKAVNKTLKAQGKPARFVTEKKKKKKAAAGGAPPSKPPKVTIVKKEGPVKWKTSNMKKRAAVVKQRIKDGNKENPNKAAKVLERHSKMQSKSPGKAIPISKALVKETRAKLKSAAKSMSSKAKKTNSKTRTKAAQRMMKNNRKKLAVATGLSVKQAEASTAAAFTAARKSNTMPDVKSAAGKLLMGAAKLALLAVVGGPLISSGAALLAAGVTAIPTGVALLAVAGLWNYIRSGSAVRADAISEENYSEYTPHIDNFVPILEDYIKTGNIEELIGMLADMQDDPENDDATSENKPHVVYSEKAGVKLTTTGAIVPDSIVIRRYPGIPVPVKAQGIYVCWTLKPHCAMKLEAWARENKIPNPKPASYLHNTIVFSKTDVCTFDGKPFRGMGLFPVPLSPQRIVKLQRLGPSAIVLKLEFEEAKERFEYLKGLGATSDFPEYISHVTVGEDDGGYVDSDFESIPLPNFALEFDYEYCGPLLVDKKQKHAVAASMGLPEDHFLSACADAARNEELAINEKFYKDPKINSNPYAPKIVGSYFSFETDKATRENLRKWLEQNKLTRHDSTNNRPPHMSIIESVRYINEKGRGPINASGFPKKVDRFGNKIVLILDSNDAVNRRKELIKKGAVSKLREDTWLPHIVVAFAPPGTTDADLAKIKLPMFAINFDKEIGAPMYEGHKSKVFDNRRPFASVLASVMEETAGRKKKPQDPAPSEHLKQAIENYRKLIERIKEFDLNGKLDQIDALAKKIENGEDVEKSAAILEEMGDHEGKNGFNNEFYDLMMQVDDGPKEIARAAYRVAKEKK